LRVPIYIYTHDLDFRLALKSVFWKTNHVHVMLIFYHTVIADASRFRTLAFAKSSGQQADKLIQNWVPAEQTCFTILVGGLLWGPPIMAWGPRMEGDTISK